MTNICWQPQPGPQSVLVNCPVEEIFYGGARGGGKTDGMIGKNAIKAAKYGKHQKGIFIRKELPQLEDAIERCKEIYYPLQWKWAEQKKTFTAPNGATLRFRSLEKRDDAEKQQGKAFTDIYFEELPNYPQPDVYNMMRACNRSAEGVFCQMHGTGNPGGPGQHWVKHRFIDPCPAGMDVLYEQIPDLINAGKFLLSRRIFIPAKVQDNPKLLEKDPGYINRLHIVGSEQLVLAWLNGDWNQVEGAFFDCWSNKLIIKNIELEDHWTRFTAFDWGFASPFCNQWWVVIGDDTKAETLDGEITVPRGAIYCYREWYGCGQPNIGLRLTDEQMRDGILERQTEKIVYSVADPSIFTHKGGPTTAERMQPIMFQPADNTRIARSGHIGGWTEMRGRMTGHNGIPYMYWNHTCKGSIRTIPALQHDQSRTEDVNCWVAGTMISVPDGEIPIEDIVIGDIVDTPIGPKPVTAAYLSGTGVTVKLTLSNGKTLEGTPNHQIYIKGRGLVSLDMVTRYNVLSQRNTLWQQKLLSMMVWFTVAMRDVTTTTQTALIYLRELKTACIDRCGRTLATLFRINTTYTTSTGIWTTTPWTISSVYLPVNIYADMGQLLKVWPPLNYGGKPQRGNGYSETITARCWKEHPSGGVRAAFVENSLQLDNLEGFIVQISALKSLAVSKLKKYVPFVMQNFGQRSTKPKKLKPVHISAVGYSEESTHVYNLTIDHIHLFYANGVVSSNTESEDHAADTARYACMSRPWTTGNILTFKKPDRWDRAFDREPQSDWKTA